MKKKKVIIPFIIAAFVILAAGCVKSGTTDATVETTESTVSEETKVTKLPPEPATQTEGDSADASGETTKGTSGSSVTMRLLPIYTLNAETLEPEAVSILIPQEQELTPQFIVDSVSETLEDQGYTITAESVTTQDDAVVVSFYKNQPPVTFGSTAESTILDVFAQSLVDNLPDYNKVIYRLEGEAYVSGHFEFGINQVYLERTAIK